MDSLSKVLELVEQRDSYGLNQMIVLDRQVPEQQYWELVSTLGEHLTEKTLNQEPHFFEACEESLYFMIESGNEEDLLLALLEQADTLTDTVRFQSFLNLIQKSILKTTEKQSFSLELALETLADNIKNLELPKDLDLEGDERRSYDLDPELDRINEYVQAYLRFLRPFVEQVIKGGTSTTTGGNAEVMARMITKHLLLCLEHPLMYLDLTLVEKNGKKLKTNTRTSAEVLFDAIHKLNPNIQVLVDTSVKWNEELKTLLARGDVEAGGYDDKQPVSEMALSCLVYLVHVEKLAPPQYPTLCPRKTQMELCLGFVLTLMSQAQSEVQNKGVLLFQAVINNLQASSDLLYDDLDRPEYFGILDAMFDIMIRCPVKDVRHTCVQLLPVFIQLFDHKGRYHIFLKIFATLKHSGAYGYCVQLFKNQMNEVIAGSQNIPQCNDLDMFYNLHLKRLLLLMTNLAEGPATDMVEHSDRIISTLNLIRFLVIRDPPHVNQTGIWNTLPQLEKDFLKALHVGLEMSKGHYKLELSGVEGRKGLEGTGAEDVEMSLSVAGLNMPKMPREEKIAVMKQALNTLDLVTSLVIRVEEVIEEKRKASPSDTDL